MTLSRRTLVPAIVAALLATGAAHAQTYPTKPVRIMVGASAGGGTDIIARMLAEKLGDAFKSTFVVEIGDPGVCLAGSLRPA